jgi:hypothetical protein
MTHERRKNPLKDLTEALLIIKGLRATSDDALKEAIEAVEERIVRAFNEYNKRRERDNEE